VVAVNETYDGRARFHHRSEPEVGIEPTTYRLQDSHSTLTLASTSNNINQDAPRVAAGHPRTPRFVPHPVPQPLRRSVTELIRGRARIKLPQAGGARLNDPRAANQIVLRVQLLGELLDFGLALVVGLTLAAAAWRSASV
jgi:hypothetical protein